MHKELLPSALKEFGNIAVRFFNLLKWIFPQISPNLSASSSPEKSEKQESADGASFQVNQVFQFLLPGTCYKVLFDLYKESRKSDEEVYANKVLKFSRQKSDLALLEFLGYNFEKSEKQVDQEDSEGENLSNQLEKHLPNWIGILTSIQTKYLATQKLDTLVNLLSDIKKFQTSADDLIPLLTFILIRAKIENLGCHLQFINDFLFRGLNSGSRGYCFTSFKSCYLYILRI